MANTRVWHVPSFILCMLGCMFCVVGHSTAQQVAGGFVTDHALRTRAAAGTKLGAASDPDIPRDEASSAAFASVPDDSCWDDGFSGFEFPVRGFAVSGSELYAATGVNVGKWDGKKWTLLSGGMNGYIATIAVKDGDVYIGGNFTSAAGVPALRIARWDGSAWNPVGGGFNNEVCALLVHDGELYAGGRFTSTGGAPASHLAHWNGSAWSEVAGGTDSTVLALCEYRSGIVAGGDFRKAGAVSARRIARLEGGQWYAFEEGTDGPVNALASRGDDIFAGGKFMTAGIVAANNIAKWNGGAWSALGAGTDKAVLCLLAVDTMIYVGGEFDSPNRHIARWGGTAWIGHPAFGGVSDNVRAFGVLGNELFMGGSFITTYMGSGDVSLDSYGCVIWSLKTSRWLAPMRGIRTAVNHAVRSADSLYLCSAPDVVRWNAGTARRYPLNIYPCYFFASIMYRDALIVGGNFSTSSKPGYSNIIRFRDGTWSALGSGLSGSNQPTRNVRALTVIDTLLFAGGDFTSAEYGNNPYMIASWNGAKWSKLGSGMDGAVRALANDGKNLYAGGAFLKAGGVQANRVARWDGTAWTPLGSGMNANVDVLAWMGGSLYAGGTFTLAGGADVFYIARWDGTRWSAFGDALDGAVTTMAVVDSELVVSGKFTHAGTLGVNRLAGWNGTRWRAYGSGLDATANAIVPLDSGAMFLGGDFTMAGGKFSWHLARWKPTGIFTGIPPAAPELFRLEQNYPNPVLPSSNPPATMIAYTLDAAMYVSLRVYDSFGRQISTLVDQRMEPGDHRCEFRADALPSGVYYYRMEGSGKSIVKKLLVQR